MKVAGWRAWVLVATFLQFGCVPKDYYLKQEATRFVKRPRVEEPKEERIAYYKENSLKSGVGDCITLHEQCLQPDDLLKSYLEAAGDTKSSKMVEQGQTYYRGIGGWGLAVALSYLIAYPFQNARDNDLWRDIAFVGVWHYGFGQLFGMASASVAMDKVVEGHDHFLLDELGLAPSDVREKKSR